MNSASTIFLATERGANLGHLGRDLALARAFKRDGHRVVLAVPDLGAADAFLGQDEFTLMQAPALRRATPARQPSLDFADMLLNLGFADVEALAGAVDAWLALFEATRPALVVYNNAPTALIAARIAKLPVQLIGTAFEIPPTGATLPRFRPELEVAPEHLASVEATVVALINEQFARHGSPTVRRVADLYPAADVRLTTLPELDPFGPREDVAYVGPVFELPQEHDVEWIRPDAHHVFAYLRPSVPGCEAMLHALQELQSEVICMVPGCPPEWIARFDRIRFFSHPLLLAFLLPRSQLVVTCGVGLITTSLLTAVPVLYMPQTVEQHLVGRAALSTGAVSLVPDTRTPASLAAALAAACGDGAKRDRALEFASSYMAIEFENNARSVVAVRGGSDL